MYCNETFYNLTGAENAPVLVLIHGLGLNCNVWNDYVPQLSKRWKVLSYDLYGHGKSGVPDTAEINLSLFSQQLNTLLEHLAIKRCALIGFSLGGMINRRFAMDYPAKTKALVILNSPHERSPEQQQLVEQKALDTHADGAITPIDATLKRWFTTDFRKNNASYIENVKTTVLDNEPTHYARCRCILANGVIELIRPTPAIDKPTLIITCEYDSGSTPQMSYAIGTEIHGSEVVIIPALQHMGLVEQPDLFLQPIMHFLEKL